MPAKSITVPIQDNQQLNFLVLSEVIRLIETEVGLDQLLRMGCDAELIDQLRHRTTRDLINLSSRSSGFVVNFYPRELLTHLNGIDRQRRDDEMCEYFVIHGASRQLLCKLFKRTGDEIRRLREILVGRGSVGRTVLPKSHHVRDEIHRTWDSIQKASPDQSFRVWLYELHQKYPNYSIETLYSTLKEFEDSDQVFIEHEHLSPTR
ncbi:STY4526/YPO1902 family pathogenicity island replication protein [Comamonas sp.]|uniref:STY4526/YPO1902 family pathogenicity island replication protein n=1 Tax=Comamonas sp. TaxID=34028 RepID=UPI00258C355E|nr:STY4526/YPO1902 family pathogenicity island replication protein [Comamonas sp.]